MGKLLQLAALLVVGILAYNYFLGNPEEKAHAKAVSQDVKTGIIKLKNWATSDKMKDDWATFQQTLKKVETVAQQLQTHGKDIQDQGLLDKLSALLQKKEALEQELSAIERDPNARKTDKEKIHIREEIDALVTELDDASQSAE